VRNGTEGYQRLRKETVDRGEREERKKTNLVVNISDLLRSGGVEREDLGSERSRHGLEKQNETIISR
jgi:hypothetical protein